MSKETILNNLRTNIHLELQPNETCDDSVAFINTLLYTKHDKNSDLLRKEILQNFSTNNVPLKENLSQYSDYITRNKFTNDLILQETKQTLEQKKTRRLSIDFEGNDDDNYEGNANANDNYDDDENVSQLRKRLLGSRSKTQDSATSATATFDEKLHQEEQKQEDVLQDMFQFVRSIKEGAEAFGSKLNEDQSVLKAAEAGLDVTSKKLSKSKNDLSKTIAALGLIDGLKLFALVILLFLLSLIIIKIFPKW